VGAARTQTAIRSGEEDGLLAKREKTPKQDLIEGGHMSHKSNPSNALWILVIMIAIPVFLVPDSEWGFTTGDPRKGNPGCTTTLEARRHLGWRQVGDVAEQGVSLTDGIRVEAHEVAEGRWKIEQDDAPEQPQLDDRTLLALLTRSCRPETRTLQEATDGKVRDEHGFLQPYERRHDTGEELRVIGTWMVDGEPWWIVGDGSEIVQVAAFRQPADHSLN
jgi:hypothetical protein